MKYDILIPAYNESENLRRIESELITELNKNSIAYQIFLINDGSSDDTLIIAEEMAAINKNIKILNHDKNKGLGAALRTGYAKCTNEWVITIDADLSYSPDQIINLVHKVSDDVDAIFGSPYMKGGKVEGVSGIRIFPSKVVNILYSLFMKKRLSCWTGIFRMVRLKSIQEIEITNDGFDSVAEIAVKLSKNKSKIVEIPATLGLRIYGESKLSLVRETVGHLKQLNRILLKRFNK